MNNISNLRNHEKRFIYVFFLTLLFASCQRKKYATLAPEYLFDAKGQKLISSLIDSKRGTISIIYGNNIALEAAGDSLPKAMPGAEYTLVTWKQKAMPGWYGTNMSGDLYSLETLEVLGKDQQPVQLKYLFSAGYTYSKGTEAPERNGRISLITSQPTAVFP
ncbi:hypothetical protein ACJVDH_08195 [Pedobacter sp. AW1-32]|uniref:hypothetical protein n=1 Tax=Pedobacter sp. AW1-32 TaxID=3383026 RepID=UPI003FED7C68